MNKEEKIEKIKSLIYLSDYWHGGDCSHIGFEPSLEEVELALEMFCLENGYEPKGVERSPGEPNVLQNGFVSFRGWFKDDQPQTFGGYFHISFKE